MDNLIVLTVAAPLLVAFLLPVVWRASRFVAASLGPVVLLFLLWLTACIATNQPDERLAYTVAIGGFLPPLGIVFYVDRLAMLFAFIVPLITLLLWPWHFDGETDSRPKQLSLMMVLVAASSGLALSGDLFNLYVFYELVAVASYGLVVNTRMAASFVAAYRYLLLSAAGSVLALLGIAIIYFKTGTLNLAHLATLSDQLHSPLGLSAFAMLVIGFGVKAELFPVNSWVPEVYLATSRRIAGLLAGLVSKLAVLVIIKAMLSIYVSPEAAQMLLLLGIAGLVLGELSAYRSTDLPRMLSWSSIGQLGLVMIAFSVSGKAGMMAGIALMIHHLVAKPALFLLAEKWGTSLNDLQGAARRSPVMGILFILFALSLMGVPPLPGFWSKFLLLTGLAGQGSDLALFAIGLVVVMTVIEAAYLFRVIVQLYAKTDRQPATVSSHKPLDALTVMLLGIVLLAGSVFVQPLTATLDRVASDAVNRSGMIETTLPGLAGRQQ